MKQVVPIYLANVTFGKYETKGRIRKKTDEVSFNKLLVKGFTIEDCIKRKEQRLIRECGLKGDVKIENIELVSQHSWGVDE